MAVCIAYEPTFQDYLALNRWIVRNRWRLVRCLSLVLVAFYLVTPWLFHDLGSEGIVLPYVQSLAVLVPPALVFAALPLSLHRSVKKRWDAAPEIREPRRFTFSEDGIAVEGATFSGRVAWSHITGVASHRGLVLLKTGQNLYYLFPEKGFPDEDARDAFAALVRRKVSPTFGRRSALGRVKFLEPSRNLDR